MKCEKNCGTCMHHKPKKNVTANYYIRTAHKYWECDIDNIGKMCEDGVGCKNYECRYQSEALVEEWIANIYAKKGGNQYGRFECDRGKGQRDTIACREQFKQNR